MEEFSTGSQRSLMVALLVAGALFMENLDGTIIATGLPKIGQAFHVAAVDVNIGMTAYLLAVAVFIPISGWVADRWGARTVFGSAIVVFTLASVLCGISQNLWEFTLARVLQGIGGAMMVPVGRLMVVRVTPKDQIMMAIAWTIWPALVAPILGPPLGGFIVDHWSWRWIFLLNVPIGIGCLIANWILVKNTHEERPPVFDFLGFLLVGGTCFSLVYAMELIGREPANWTLGGILFAVSAACAVLSLWHLRRVPNPLFDLEVLRIRTFSAVMWGGSAFRVAIFMAPFLLPLMFQLGFGLNAFQSGSLTLAVFAGNLAMKPVTTPLLRRFGFRTVLLWNGVLTAGTLLWCGLLQPWTPHWLVLIVLFLSGLGRSMQLTSLTTMGYADLPKEKMSTGSAFASTVQQMTVGGGVAFGVLLLRGSAVLHGRHGGAPQVIDFRWAFYVVAALALLSLLDVRTLPHSAGAAVSGHVMEREEPVEA